MALLAPESIQTLSLTQASSPTATSSPVLPPIVTSKTFPALPPPPPLSPPANRFSIQSRLSSSSNSHHPLHNNPLSRPVSTAFPHFHTSLSYALVRDFAYPSSHPCHYGPPPPRLAATSGTSTPSNNTDPYALRRVSDPVPHYDANRIEWLSWDSSVPPSSLPRTSYAERDGPPYSEDDDLASPIVTTSRHRKNKSSSAVFSNPSGRTRPASRLSSSSRGPPPVDPDATATPRRSYSRQILPNRVYTQEPQDKDSDDDDNRRFSRDYQFTIVSPEEEMHGRAVALFDFRAENENELSMTEGMIVFISFRHGQGWLVAQNLKTKESGLVPEEYVRLLRDIEGGYDGLFHANGDHDEAKTPVQESQSNPPAFHQPMDNAIAANDSSNTPTNSKFRPVVSTFSITRDDLEPIPKSMLNSPLSATPAEDPGKSLDQALDMLSPASSTKNKQTKNNKA